MRQSGLDISEGVPPSCAHLIDETSSAIEKNLHLTNETVIKVKPPPLLPTTVIDHKTTDLGPVENKTVKIKVKKSEIRVGIVDVLKEEVDSRFSIAIVSGAFKLEENIREFVGSHVVGPDGEEGEVLGPFAKTGKCKVKFPKGIVGPVGTQIQIKIDV